MYRNGFAVTIRIYLCLVVVVDSDVPEGKMLFAYHHHFYTLRIVVIVVPSLFGSYEVGGTYVRCAITKFNHLLTK